MCPFVKSDHGFFGHLRPPKVRNNPRPMESRTEIRTVISQNLRKLMTENRYTKSELATRSGVSPRMIQMVLSEERTPGAEVLASLGKGLGVPGWLLMAEFCPDSPHAAGMMDIMAKKFSGLSEQNQALAVAMIQAFNTPES